MNVSCTALRDHGLEARVVCRRRLAYEAGPAPEADRPAHVRAASGLSYFREYLVAVQDDAHWLALIDGDDRVHALPLPSRHGDERVFSASRGNKHRKFDLEACTTVPGEEGHEFVAFGSGSHQGREWILRLHEGTPLTADLSDDIVFADGDLQVTAEFMNARPFYDSLRANTAFCGARLNIEGALSVGPDRVMLFQRGNAPPSDSGLPPTNATAEVSWRALKAHLADPSGTPPPRLERIRRYDLGSLGGVPLAFSDAELTSSGAILFSASAEDPVTDAVSGSALGIIEPSGSARWAPVTDEEGRPFRGKIEGLSYHPRDPRHVRFVVDDDDETLPSELFDTQLSGGFPPLW